MKKTILLLAILTICASVLAQKNRMEQEFGKRSKVKIENTIYTYDRTLQIVEDSTNNEAPLGHEMSRTFQLRTS